VKWSWSDAWLLTAAYFTEENPVSLRSLFAAGDAINHAIFTDDEIDHGLTRLQAAGLAHLESEAIVLADDAIRLCEEAVKSTPYMFEGTKRVEAALRKIDLTGKDFKLVEVPKPAVRAALEQYHKDAARTIAELRASDLDS
jgi:hypothetical protein